MMTIVTPGETPAWNEYVTQHPKGTIFHTEDMVNVFHVTPGYEPFARAAVNEAGDIVALLVAVRVETVSGIASSFASRSIFFAEPICNDNEEGIAGLVELIQLHDRQMKRTTVFSEVRPIGPPGAERIALERCGYDYLDYLNYVVDLMPDIESVRQRLSKSCRQNINRCRNKNVVVREETTAAGIDEMYQLLQCSYEHARVPLADVRMFHAAREMLPPGTVQVRIVSHQGVAVAAGIVLVFKGVIYAWYGGTSRPRGLAPFDILTWDEIEWGCTNHQQLYDFGGAGWPDEDYGPRHFKSKFGGRLVNHGRYRKVSSRWKLALAQTSYRALRRTVSPVSSK